MPLTYKWALFMAAKRTHIVIPEQLVKEIDRLVGTRQRSSFLTQAAERELLRRRQFEAIESATGSWKDAKHPELRFGSVQWVKRLRRENERRFQKPPYR